MYFQLNRIKWFLFVFIIFSLFKLNCNAQSFISPGNEAMSNALAAIDNYAERVLKEQRIPGLSLAITCKDSLIYSGSYGYSDMKLKTPITDTTLFQIGSISKSFTAVALIQLVDEGKLVLDKPVEYYLPWFSISTAYDPITIHHLLTHSAGIPSNRDDITGSPYMAFALQGQKTGWPPGNQFYYSNIGYQVLHVLLEKLRQEDYKTIIIKNIFEPLQMDKSRAYISLESRRNQAIGYIYPFDDRPPHSSRALVEAPHFEYSIGDGCIQSTAIDMAAYLRMLMSFERGRNSTIISEDAYKKLTAKHVALPKDWGGGHYGYGLFMQNINGQDILYHSGGMIGFTSLIAADVNNGIGVVLLFNGPAELYSIGNYCLSSVLAAQQNKVIPEPPVANNITQVDNAEDYNVHFSNAFGESILFRARDNHLYLISNSGEDILLELYGKDKFYTPHPEYDLYKFQFVRNDSNDVYEVFHGPKWYTGVSYKETHDFNIPKEWKFYTGKYRSYSPWFPYFEIFVSKGKLIALTGQGGEVRGREYILIEKKPGVFIKEKDFPQEIIVFKDIVNNKALRAVWSGHQFYRSN